ncbi:hypothetical protein MHPYR_140071 [uncultured Mycobacterium sp.]|uniref:Uncharacterized protein n=1 Tax=uncultured Mycobacterium sp. TaxID=171292 RepID=A0A1Y5P5L1_9MYCO|nr:hypothetical protein MHPYR_140071 [uncultured Mycobacterium sp.]
MPGSAAANGAQTMPVPPQSKPHAITQLIAAAFIGERFTTFLVLAAQDAPRRMVCRSLWHIRRSR